jgi:hypothetical protein
MVSAWPEPPNAKSAGARCGVQGTFAVGGTETPERIGPSSHSLIAVTQEAYAPSVKYQWATGG